MCGRLVGAAEMAALRMQQQSGDMAELGGRLEEMVRWFVETEPIRTSFGRTIQVPRRAGLPEAEPSTQAFQIEQEPGQAA